MNLTVFEGLFVMRVFFYLIVFFLLPTTVFGEIKIIQLPISNNVSKKAFFVSPSGNGKFPAIVYMHGGAAREKSDPSFFKEKILDYSSLGFVVLAPLRNTVEGCCNGDDAIKEGIRVARESAKYLGSLPNVRKEKICLVGFSEGALISMWVMTESNNFSKAVIMSASTQCQMQRAGAENYCSRRLIKSGKLKKVTKKVILTLGTLDKRGHVKTANKFSEKLSTPVNILDGNHRSFLDPRKDVNSIIMDNCS